MLPFVWLSVTVSFLASLTVGPGAAEHGLIGSGAPPRLQATKLSVASPAPTFNAREHVSWLAPQARSGAGLIFVSTINHGGGVEVYSNTRHPQIVGFIGDGIRAPYGIFVGPSKNLYVCDFERDVVTVFPPGQFRPAITYREGLLSPLFVTADSAGNVYVANRGTWIDGALVTEFGPGSTKPTAFLTTPGVEADGLALDAGGNLDVSYRFKDGHGGISQFSAGTHKRTDLGIQIDQPQGLAVDANDDIVVVDTGYHVIDIFPPGATEPSQQISSVFVPNSIVFNSTRKQLLVSSQRTRGTIGIYALAYPEGAPRPRISNQYGGIVGVALSSGANLWR